MKTTKAFLCVLLLVVSLAFVSAEDGAAQKIKLFPQQAKKLQVQASPQNNTQAEESQDVLLSEPIQKEILTNQFSIELSEESKQTESYEADYEIIVKSHYFKDAEALTKKQYEIFFESDDGLSGELSASSLSLAAGEKEFVKLKVKTQNLGTHNFLVKVIDENGGESVAEGHLEAKASKTQPLETFNLALQPEKEFSQDGSATYKIIVSSECTIGECAQSEYDLIFQSEQDSLTGSFVKGYSGLIKPGQKLNIPLKVEAQEKGVYVFKVSILVDGIIVSSTKGLFTYGESHSQASSSSYFEGQGFATNEESSSGSLISITLLQNENEIRGKLDFDEKSYALKGASENSEISFDIYDAQKNGFEDSIGNFQGEIKNFDTFSLLKGRIIYSSNSPYEEYWELSALSRDEKVFDKEITVASSQATKQTINKNEVVTIKNSQKENSRPTEAYIIPQEIEKKKILGFIPNPWGDKTLKVKLVEGATITEQTVEEFGNTQIGDYDVHVGSLDNEEAIEVSVTKSN